MNAATLISAEPWLAASLPAGLPAAPTDGRRFTLDGDETLERDLELACRRVTSGVRGIIPPEKLEAVLLGGGYGRGEGGVLRGARNDQPYNDLEFYVAVRGNRHLNEVRYRRALDVLGEILAHLAGVEVEFKLTSTAEWRTQPVSMFSYDLFSGYRLLWGDPAVLHGCAHHRQAREIPLSEATRLLMNRGTGLLLAKAKLAADPLAAGAADFIRRNVAKAQLACGDAVLAARGLYDHSCRERHRHLERIARLEPSAWHAALLRHHAAGVDFKLHPVTAPLPRAALMTLHGAVSELMRECWLRLESQRLGRAFPSVCAYAQDPCDKAPGGSRLRHLALNLRADGFRPHLRPSPWRHPRQRIFNALALLLWEPEAVARTEIRVQLQRELHTRATSWAGLMRAYEALWCRVR